MLNDPDWDEAYDDPDDGAVAAFTRWICQSCALLAGMYAILLAGSVVGPVVYRWAHSFLWAIIPGATL